MCLATLIQWIAAIPHMQLEKHKLEGSAFSSRQIMSLLRRWWYYNVVKSLWEIGATFIKISLHFRGGEGG